MSENNSMSILRLERLAFERIDYSRDILTDKKPSDYEMNFNREISTRDDKQHFKVSLTANLWDKDSRSINLTVKLSGFFFCDCEDEELKKELVQYNTLAIMFPYIRSQVSLISTQPDMPPIIIPAVNIVGMFKEVDRNEALKENP